MSKQPVNALNAALFLRRVAVFVDEPDPGQYFWVLIESKEDASVWLDIDASEGSFPTWHAALDAGNVALMKLVENKQTGPLAAGEDENASPVGSPSPI